MDYDYDPIPLPHRQDLSPAESLARAQVYCEFISQRHTVRHFTDEPVSREVIEACVRAAGTAPSGANHQPWHFACVSDPKIKREIRLSAAQAMTHLRNSSSSSNSSRGPQLSLSRTWIILRLPLRSAR